MGDVFGDSPWAMEERPVREVRVGDFLIGRCEVTIGEFTRFVESTGYRTVAEVDPAAPRRAGGEDTGPAKPTWRAHWFEQAPDHPVVLMAWEDAVAYCNWRSREEGLPPAYDSKSGTLLDANGASTADVRQTRGYRLPTEAEWEFAARERGRKVRFGNGQDIARSSEMNFDAAGTGRTVPSLRLKADNLYPYNEPGVHRKGTTPVGAFRPNALGLHDMSGNAWEWCTDTGGASFGPGPLDNPCQLGGNTHLLRGGMHDTDAKACRVSARIDWRARAWCAGSGFRIARSVEKDP